MKYQSRIIAEVDKLSWKKNYLSVKNSVNPCRVMPIIKADAYGLGALEMAELLKDIGVEILGVSCPLEAWEIRNVGVDVLILGPMLEDEIDKFLEHNSYIIPTVQDFDFANKLNKFAVEKDKIIRVNIAIDTGMGRFGFLPNKKAIKDISKINQLSNIELHGIYSHMAKSGACSDFSERQINLLTNIIKELEDIGITFYYRHIGNSTACANYNQAMQEPFNLIRCGIDLHGANIYPRPYPTYPVLSLKSKLLSIRHLPCGSPIGYGSEYVVTNPEGETIGVVAIGYADGYPRNLFKKGSMLVHGKKCKITGIICMDYTMITLDHVPQAKVGDEVVIIGKQGEQEITISEVARQAGTIPYEFMCGLGTRVKIKYLK